jgi:hypothetical protein
MPVWWLLVASIRVGSGKVKWKGENEAANERRKWKTGWGLIQESSLIRTKCFSYKAAVYNKP